MTTFEIVQVLMPERRTNWATEPDAARNSAPKARRGSGFEPATEE